MQDSSSNARAELYKKALAASLLAAEQMRKYLMIVIGVVLYISFLVMATVFYSPNYRACMVKCGTLWSLANAIAQAVFFVFVAFYVIRQCIGASGQTSGGGGLGVYLAAFDRQLPYTLGLCVLYMVVSYGILFFTCMDSVECPGCSPSQQTAFNTMVTAQVNRSTPLLQELNTFYNEVKQDNPARIDISTCANYYDDGYMASIKDGRDPKSCARVAPDGQQPTCVGADFITNVDRLAGDTNGGPTLSQFFVMTSGRTCVVDTQYDGYMSPAMIKIVLNAGARCLDFDITNHSYAKNSFPIVTNTRDSDKRNLQQNFVLFEDAIRTVSSVWLQTKTDSVPRDPLFLRLSFHSGTTTDCMDQVAYLLQYYLNEQHGQHLMPVQWQYKNVDKAGGLGVFPICSFFDRIVILVSSPCRPMSPLLDGMANALYGYVAKENNASDMSGTSGSGKSRKSKSTTQTKYNTEFVVLDAKEVRARDKNERSDLIELNRKGLTYVDTNFHPYSLVGHKQCMRTQRVDDSLSTLIWNKQTINNDPLPAFATGCQFIAMNFQHIDAHQKLYLNVFANSSFLLKPRKMWPIDVMTPAPTPTNTCHPDETPYVKKDDDSHCYQACLPDVNKPSAQTGVKKVTQDIYNRFLQTITGARYKLLTKNEDACARGDKYEQDATQPRFLDPIGNAIDNDIGRLKVTTFVKK